MQLLRLQGYMEMQPFGAAQVLLEVAIKGCVAQTMRILVAAPFFQEGSTALFLFKAVAALGHVPVVWDYRHMRRGAVPDYDVALVWAAGNLADYLRADRPRVMLYLDDPTYWERYDRSRTLQAVMGRFDFLFSQDKIPGFEDLWMPMGSDTDVFFPLEDDAEIAGAGGKVFDVSFIGTARGKARTDFVVELKRRCDAEGLRMAIFGNGWDEFGIRTRAVYFREMNRVMNASKVVINEHWNLAPSTKAFEIAACGNTVFLSDDREAVRECLPGVKTYRDVDGAVDVIRHYRDSWDSSEARAYAARMREASQKYSYEAALGRILEKCGLADR